MPAVTVRGIETHGAAPNLIRFQGTIAASHALEGWRIAGEDRCGFDTLEARA